MDASPSLRVVVFESANPEFYVAHFDLEGHVGRPRHPQNCRAFRPPILLDTFVRLTKSPSSHREDPWPGPGVGSEFVLALRHAIRIAREGDLGSSRVGAESSGGGGTERLPLPPRPRSRAENRSRCDDFDGETLNDTGTSIGPSGH